MKVLVPLDGSDTALSILAGLRRILAPAFGADQRIAGLLAVIPSDEPIPAPPPLVDVHLLTVLHASRPSRPAHAATEASGTGEEIANEAPDRLEREAREHLETVAREHFPDAATTCHVIWADDAAAAIGTFAVDLDVDAIAMATHGRSGVSRLLVGSVAERVIRDSYRPVVVQHPSA